MRVTLLAIALILLVELSAPAEAQQGPTADPPPNILWISAEDLSPRLGAYGDPVARTPNLDRLAAQGVRYTRAFTTAGVCAPSRSAIITGMYQNGIGTHHMRTSQEGPGLPTPYEAVPPPYVKAFTEHLRDAGYFATNSWKTDYQFGNPFTVWDESSREAHWRSPRRAEGQPFFAVFNLNGTHESQSWVRPGDTIRTDPASVDVPPYYPDTPDVRRQIAKHYDNIARIDAQVGEILDQLEADGLADNTIVFFWGDHGDGLPRAKRWTYDAGLLAPLIVRWPGAVRPGTADDRLISFIDLAPTVLSLAGVPVPVHMDGRAFLGPRAAPPREYVHAARDRIDLVYDMVRATRDARFKYIRNYYPETPYVQLVPYRNQSGIMQDLLRLHAEGALTGAPALWLADSRPPEELYDVEADPHEVHNLAGDPELAEVLDRMRRATDRWMEDIDDLGRVPEDRMVRAMWPAGEQPVTSAPVITPRRANAVGAPDTLDAGAEIDIYCGTHGASVAYTTGTGESPHWLLYDGPVVLPPGTTTLRAKAVRYGYKESEETVVTVTVRTRE
jgi:N-sulfoglucosamine sulfohydrolase